MVVEKGMEGGTKERGRRRGRSWTRGLVLRGCTVEPEEPGAALNRPSYHLPSFQKVQESVTMTKV